jgi:four helix bundle protein
MANSELGMGNYSNVAFGMRSSELGRKWNMKNNLKDRTKQFALRVIRLCEALPKGKTAKVIGGQLLRCGTSVGANYRAACRARSTAEFIAKMGIVEEECDECLYWMELLIEAALMPDERLRELMREADELLAITVSSIKTARQKVTKK